MADEMAPLRRDEIAQFAKSPRQVRFFEEMGKAVATTIPTQIQGAPSDSQTVLAAGMFGQRAPLPPGVFEPSDAVSPILAARTFAPAHAAPPPAPDTASLILAGQIFGA